VQILYNMLFWLDIIIAFAFTVLVIFQGAKAGGLTGASASVRTSYKGKPGFDDFLSRITLYIGVGFMGVTLIVQFIAHRWLSQH
jgi:protein translocase SecG subunit